MTSRKEQNSKKAVATYDAEKFKDIFGTTTSIPRTKRRMTAFKKLTIPKKKSKEECKVPVGLIDDLKKTINKKDNKGYECPFCFERLEPPYPEELTKAIEETKEKQKECEERQKKEYEAKLKKEKAEGRLYIEPFILSMEGISDYDKKKFCDVHKMELELKPLGRERGYPEDIDFDGLNIRLKRLKEDLLEIIDGRKESEYFVEIKKKVGNLGVNKARDTTELINEFQSGLPGYYGMRGMEKMMDIMRNMFLDKELDKKKSHPLMPIEYIQRVLVPESGIRLIEQDMKVDRLRAKKIMEESIEYGKRYNL